ncbi:hypothetical protein G7066_13615 [Leucobacter coleopterorum]|uniref:Uncharacterized protein n=1 Tax=Leucobacter coleopterorum TaxID=2714933 RepID=A0ABX6JZL2_9MICO|nr:hypothetical protein [Leucobacter coleopterorum]QIM19351.1 hypothetical protein G7066_13615 [Leucobacter coleopterorum]
MSTATALRGGSWAAGIPTGGYTVPTGPPPTIAFWALSYIQPLQNWWEELLGDPASIASVADSWDTVESNLRTVAADLEAARSSLDGLEGRTIRTLELRYSDLIPVAQDAGDWAGSAAAAARLASSIVEAVRSFILDFLYQLSRLIEALFGFTLNPFSKLKELQKLMSAASELIRAGGELIQNMFDAFQRLIELLGALGPVIELANQHLRSAVANMLPIVGGSTGLLGLMGGGIMRDFMTDGGDVSRYDIDELERLLAADPTNESLKQKVAAWREAHKVKSLNSLADLVGVNGTTDRMGGGDSTVFDIKLVRAKDGSEHWVVSLPSTQEWIDMGGSGAMNDGKNNIALFLDNPALKTQYERAVMQAMREAGMKPGDPVVFTGFSQGGIMAVNLASDPTLPYKPIGVVTNGSPIGTFTPPANVPVVAFEYITDVVPKLDANPFHGLVPGLDTNPNNRGMTNVHTRVLTTGSEANPLRPLDSAPWTVHNNDKYVDAIKDQAADLSKEYAWMGGDVIDHQIFSATQR